MSHGDDGHGVPAAPPDPVTPSTFQLLQQLPSDVDSAALAQPGAPPSQPSAEKHADWWDIPLTDLEERKLKGHSTQCVLDVNGQPPSKRGPNGRSIEQLFEEAKFRARKRKGPLPNYAPGQGDQKAMSSGKWPYWLDIVQKARALDDAPLEGTPIIIVDDDDSAKEVEEEEEDEEGLPAKKIKKSKKAPRNPSTYCRLAELFILDDAQAAWSRHYELCTVRQVQLTVCVLE